MGINKTWETKTSTTEVNNFINLRSTNRSTRRPIAEKLLTRSFDIFPSNLGRGPKLSHKINNAKKNYTTTKREAIAMVYGLHKFKHYLLGNKFVLYVNHMALLYLVKKPQLLRRIVKWMLLFLEYDFSMVYKLGHSHLVANVLLQLLDVTENLGVFDRTTNASLFVLQPKWLHEVCTYISTRNFLEGYSTEQRKKLLLKALPFYHHQWKVVQTRARSNFVSMFA